MLLNYSLINLPNDSDMIVNFLSDNDWPFHVNPKLSKDSVRKLIKEGYFNNSETECFLISYNSSIVGLIKIFDLDDIDDGYPMFDLRISNGFRGNGIGTKAVKWLTDYLFSKYENLQSIVGTTRMDNKAMRNIFKKNLFVKEGHFRSDWECTTGEIYDTIRYCILRDDWISGKMTPVNWNEE